MRIARNACRYQLLALVMPLLMISSSALANAGETAVSDVKEFDEAYWQEFLSTPFTDSQSPTDIIKAEEHHRELAYTYGYDYPGEICDHSGFLQVDHIGVEKCITRGRGLCKDGWEFGIYRKGTSYFVQLRKESDRNNPVYIKYEGATELCIGERPGNVAYMSIKFDHGTQYLIGKDVGSRNKLPRLKIRPQEGKCRGDNKDARRMLGKCDNEVIVKYRDGAGDDDCLWEVFFDGETNTCSGSGWVFIPWPPQPTASPSSDCQANVDMACIATRVCGGVSDTRDCDNIPKCSMSMTEDVCCKWTLKWNYKITNKCENLAEIKSLETTLCHGHCHGGMAPYGECLEESNPKCDTVDLSNSLMPSGQTIDAFGMKLAVENWVAIDLEGMDGAKLYGNSTITLKTIDGRVRTGEASKCIDLCDKTLMSRAGDTGGISNGENVAVIVDSIITDEETLEQDEAGGTGGISNGENVAVIVDSIITDEETLEQDEAGGTGGISNGENVAVIVDSIITDEETLEQDEATGDKLVSDPPTVGPTAAPVSASASPVSDPPTASPSAAPVSDPPTQSPSASPVSDPPTQDPSASPVSDPPSAKPTDAPVSSDPTPVPTSPPTDAPVSSGPTKFLTPVPSTLPVSAIPTSTPTISKESSSLPTNIPTDVLAAIAEPRTNPFPCKVSAAIGCAVAHNEKLIECQNFRKSSQDVIEIQWTYSIINECEYPVRARRAMIMKCHKCPTLTSTNGPNACTSDTSFFKEAKGGRDITISGGDSFQLTEYDTVDLTDTCALSPIISSFSRFIAMRISADDKVELVSSQVTAANSLGPVCIMNGGPFPGSLSCETDRLWEDAPEETENGSL